MGYMNEKGILIVAGWTVGGNFLTKLLEKSGYDVGKFDDELSRMKCMDTRVLRRFLLTWKYLHPPRDDNWEWIKNFLLSEKKKVFRVRGVCQLWDFEDVLKEAREKGFEIKAIFIAPRKIEIDLFGFKKLIKDAGFKREVDMELALKTKIHQEESILNKLNELQIPVLRVWFEDFAKMDVISIIEEFLNERLNRDAFNVLYEEAMKVYNEFLNEARKEFEKDKKVESGCGGCP